MDVVKTNLQKIGGTVDLDSTAGQGTTIGIKIPLTLAIVPALVVRCCGERFAIPQVSLLELVRLEGGKGIESANGTSVYRLRGRLLPLVYLDELLRLRPSTADASQPGSNGSERNRETALANVNIAVLQAETRQFGLVVDDILNTEEIVVKPLGKQLKDIKVYSGATIMGDGSVALILDVKGVAARAGLLEETGATASDEGSNLAPVRAQEAGGDHRRKRN